MKIIEFSIKFLELNSEDKLTKLKITAPDLDLSMTLEGLLVWFRKQDPIQRKLMVFKLEDGAVLSLPEGEVSKYTKGFKLKIKPNLTDDQTLELQLNYNRVKESKSWDDFLIETYPELKD